MNPEPLLDPPPGYEFHKINIEIKTEFMINGSLVSKQTTLLAGNDVRPLGQDHVTSKCFRRGE